MSELLPNSTLLDYRIDAVLGRGGFGVTYLGFDTGLQRKVAIKEYFPLDWGMRDPVDATIRPHTTTADDYAWGLERFLNEARTLARFKHPAIVSVSRIFEANGTAYMVLDYEEGQSLGAWFKSLESPPTQVELDQITEPLLDALELVHGASILHRDIAPDNIYIRRNGTPVLLDFGSAREALGQRSHSMSAIVKSGFSPLEQYSNAGRSQGPWTDIYALGATLYLAITGRKPPEAPDRIDGAACPPAASIARATYRSGFLAGVDKALMLSRLERPQSVADWRPMLFDGVQSNQPTRAPAPTPASNTMPPSPPATPPRAFQEPISAHPPVEPVRSDPGAKAATLQAPSPFDRAQAAPAPQHPKPQEPAYVAPAISESLPPPRKKVNTRVLVVGGAVLCGVAAMFYNGLGNYVPLPYAPVIDDRAMPVRLAEASLEDGKSAARSCETCHSFENGGLNKSGSNLWGIYRARFAEGVGFSFSVALRKAGETGRTWTSEELDNYLADPKGHIPGTSMNFRGVRDPATRADLIVYLRTLRFR